MKSDKGVTCIMPQRPHGSQSIVFQFFIVKPPHYLHTTRIKFKIVTIKRIETEKDIARDSQIDRQRCKINEAKQRLRERERECNCPEMVKSRPID